MHRSESTRVAVVTGAASGIGRAVTEDLLTRGWAVAALDRDESGLRELAANRPGRVTIRRVDITEAEGVARAFDEVRADQGPIDSVVAAAGIWTPGSVDDLTDEQWTRAISVNLTGMFNTARVSVQHLLERGGGSFVAVASDVGVQGSQNCAAYVVAKHGVVGLVKSMALDFGHQGIRSNAICPGFVETAMTEEIFRSFSPERLKARSLEVPAGRFAKPAEVASVIGSVVDPAFSFVNGAVLLVDGGATAGYHTREAHD